jgi:hypothetical protein
MRSGDDSGGADAHNAVLAAVAAAHSKVSRPCTAVPACG